MSVQNFDEFSKLRQVHRASHQGLTSILIPQWLKDDPKKLDGNIESSAYGETPERLVSHIRTGLRLSSEDTFLDLGAGAGNLLAAFCDVCREVVGFERNPNLVALGREFLEVQGRDPERLKLADFLTEKWPPKANKFFAASARFDRNTLQKLAERLNSSSSAQAVAFLGRSPDMGTNWELQLTTTETVRWNRDEASREEPFKVWLKIKIS